MNTHPDSNKLRLLDQAITTCEVMELGDAKKVLQLIIGVHEKTFSVESDLARIGGFDLSQIREALGVVAQDLVDSDPISQHLFYGSMLRKQTPYGDLSLTQKKHLGVDLKFGRPGALYMTLCKGGEYIIESEVPLLDSTSWVVQNSVRFADFRRKEGMISMYSLKKKFSIEKYQYIWRGLRWLSANMLQWNSRFVLPEDLDQLALA